MADIIDPNESDINDELTEFDSPTETENQATAEPDDDLPEKFKGKSAKEIAKAYEEAEKLASRHAQEVGELRKLTDEILKSQLAAQKQSEKPQAQELDFFDDPETKVKQVVENHPAVVEARKTAALLKAQQVKGALEEKHGKLEDFAQDPDFINFVKGSKVRMSLMAAAENYDFDAADELLSTYKEIKGVKAKQAEQQTEEIKQNRDKSLKAASVPMGSGNGESSKKIYRRADLIRLMQTDRRRYEAMEQEILAAYSEGRVK